MLFFKLSGSLSFYSVINKNFWWTLVPLLGSVFSVNTNMICSGIQPMEAPKLLQFYTWWLWKWLPWAKLLSTIQNDWCRVVANAMPLMVFPVSWWKPLLVCQVLLSAPVYSSVSSVNQPVYSNLCLSFTLCWTVRMSVPWALYVLCVPASLPVPFLVCPACFTLEFLLDSPWQPFYCLILNFCFAFSFLFLTCLPLCLVFGSFLVLIRNAISQRSQLATSLHPWKVEQWP